MAMKLAGSAAFLVAGVNAAINEADRAIMLQFYGQGHTEKKVTEEAVKATNKAGQENWKDHLYCAYSKGVGAPVIGLPKGESADCCSSEQANLYHGSATADGWDEPVTKDFTNLSGAISFYTQDKEGSRKEHASITYVGPDAPEALGGFANPFQSRPDRFWRASWAAELQKFSMTQFSTQIQENQIGNTTYKAIGALFTNEAGQTMSQVIQNMEQTLINSCVLQSKSTKMGTSDKADWHVENLVDDNFIADFGIEHPMKVAINECKAFSMDIHDLTQDNGKYIIAKCDKKFVQPAANHGNGVWPIRESQRVGNDIIGGLIDLSAVPNSLKQEFIGLFDQKHPKTASLKAHMKAHFVNQSDATFSIASSISETEWTNFGNLLKQLRDDIDQYFNKAAGPSPGSSAPHPDARAWLGIKDKATWKDKKAVIEGFYDKVHAVVLEQRKVEITHTTRFITTQDLAANKDFWKSAQTAYDELYWPECCCGYSQCCCLATWLSVGGSLFVIISAVVTMFMCGFCDDEGAQPYTGTKEPETKPDETKPTTDGKEPATTPEETESKGCGCCVWVIIAIVVVVVIVGLVYCCSGSSNKEMEEESDEDVEP